MEPSIITNKRPVHPEKQAFIRDGVQQYFEDMRRNLVDGKSGTASRKG